MTPTEARRLAASLVKAAQAAEAEGREHIVESDLDVFAMADDAARASLAATIAAMTGQPVGIGDN